MAGGPTSRAHEPTAVEGIAGALELSIDERARAIPQRPAGQSAGAGSCRDMVIARIGLAGRRSRSWRHRRGKAHHRPMPRVSSASTGTVACWGNDYLGFDGQRATASPDRSRRRRRVAGLDNASVVTVGQSFICGLRQSGGGSSPASASVPFRAGPDPNEWSHREVARADHRAEAWEVPGSEGASSVDAGAAIGCAVIGGLVKCLREAIGEGGSFGGGDEVGDSLFGACDRYGYLRMRRPSRWAAGRPCALLQGWDGQLLGRVLGGATRQ